MSPRRLAVLGFLLAATAAHAQQPPAMPAAPVQPTNPAGAAAPGSTPNAVIPVAPGSPPAAAAVDISSTRPAQLPRMEGRPAATQVVPGPDATGATPPQPPSPR